MEKTFEDLVKQNCIEIDWTPGNYIPIGRVEALMQQVREATIAECHVIADKYYFQNSGNIIRDINQLPTDRIKLNP